MEAAKTSALLATPSATSSSSLSSYLRRDGRSAGVLIAFYVLSITWIAPRFGVGNAVFFVLMGQMVSAGLIDHFGLFGARVVPMTPIRAAGLAAMAAGLFMTQIAGRR